MITLNKKQARTFLLYKQGLIGEHRFTGKQGALDFMRQAGCIQFDPVDVCGKNAELTLQSRVKGFTKQTLYELLYEDRKLVDYPDKNLSIIPISDWPYFGRYRHAALRGGEEFPELEGLCETARAYIHAHGPVCSDELPIEGKIYWHSSIHWSGNWGEQSNAARSVLEQLYSTGELIIHHKCGSRKYYDFTDKYLPAELLAAPDPLPDEFAHRKWRVLRRIGAVGLMWNRPSDAWLNIWGLKADERTRAFEELLAERKLLEVHVEGIKHAFYCHNEDLPFLEMAFEEKPQKSRCELIAPLDCMMWDRKLIHELFDFEYTWEIYTPAAKRKYGYYVLPLLCGDRFIGHAEFAADTKAGILTIKHVWYEDGVKDTKRLRQQVQSCFKRFARFNRCKELRVEADIC